MWHYSLQNKLFTGEDVAWCWLPHHSTKSQDKVPSLKTSVPPRIGQPAPSQPSSTPTCQGADIKTFTWRRATSEHTSWQSGRPTVPSHLWGLHALHGPSSHTASTGQPGTCGQGAVQPYEAGGTEELCASKCLQHTHLPAQLPRAHLQAPRQPDLG